MKSEILRLLKECEGYLSGQQICDYFQVSRTAVWKIIEKLKTEGYQIEAVRNRGYRLVGSPDVISKAEIESLARDRWAGAHVVYYDETDSTNNRAKDAGERGEAHGTLYVADRQSAGKGRRGRGWESPAGMSVYMTLLLRPDIMPTKAPQMTLLMAVAVVEGIRKVTGIGCEIKWPNDVVLHGKKICGILTEMSAELTYVNYVVIGVGINVNQESFSEEIKGRATSLKAELGHSVRRSELIAAVMEGFERCYAAFLETQNLSKVVEEYNALLVNRDRTVKVLEPGNEYEAHALGIDESGKLIVRTKDGQENAVYAGEVSVRGVYGYV